jgi:excisionase family DNA binding protein
MKKRFISYMETAQFLGLSRPTIDRLIARGEIPSYKIGKRRLFDPEELVEWVKSHRNGPRVSSKKEGRRTSKGKGKS